MNRLIFSIFILGLSVWNLGCQASKLTNNLSLREGPPLLLGRLSATLGTVLLKDKRLLVIGGSLTEYPFNAITGPQTIEILNAKWSQWQSSGIDIPYPISGEAFQFEDGRIIAFAGIYSFNPKNNAPTSFPKDKSLPQTGAVAAVIIDLKKKSVLPIYRPKNNDPAPGIAPVSGHGITLIQRAFAHSLQLKNGRILRTGGRVLATNNPPQIKCENARCRYCQNNKCGPHEDGDYACKSEKDCPVIDGSSHKQMLKVIEIYTPPDAKHPQGQVKRVYMDEGRRNIGIIELRDGRVLITGGQGPLGEGINQVFRSTYLLNPDTGELRKGPNLRTGREDHALAMLKNGSILITGGSNLNAVSINLTEIFIPSSEQIIDGISMDLPREDHQFVALGTWLLFLGGENNSKNDLIRNSGEAFDSLTGLHISSFLLFSREEVRAQSPLCPNAKGYAGVDDFAAVTLDPSHVIILGGQQGCLDRDGDYISPGKGSRRTLFIELPQP